MSEARDIGPDAEWRRPILRVVLTVAIFAVLWPGAVYAEALLVSAVMRQSWPSTDGAIRFVYPLAILPGIAVGGFVAWADRFPGNSFIVAAFAGAVVGLCCSFVMYMGARQLVRPSDGHAYEVTFFFLGVMAISVIATMVCWGLARWLRRFG